MQERTDAALVQATPEAPTVQIAAPDRTVEPTLAQEEGTGQATEVTSRETATEELHVGAQGQDAGRPSGKHANKRVMRCKKVLLITDSRVGHDFTHIIAMLPVFSAVGWKTDIALEQHDGHAMELASKAAEKGYDLVIADGDDGTINRAVNGVMGASSKGRHSLVGVLPGATAGQQVTETSVPVDPVRAAFALVDSDIHTVDVGRMRVQALLSVVLVSIGERKRRYPTEMRFHIKERGWSLSEAFVVRDDVGSAVFEIRGAFVNINDDLVLIDRSTSKELARAHIRQHPLLLALHYEIYLNGQLWASMLDRFRLFHEDFKIETGDGSALHVRGDTWRWNFSVIDQAGHPLARIGRQYSIFPDSYAIEVAQHVDAVAIVALVIVMDMVRERQEQPAR
jgi:uncharacterized protein YxjI